MLRWNEVTWYSKLGAAIVIFGALSALLFYTGLQYEKDISISATTTPAIVNQIRPQSMLFNPKVTTDIFYGMIKSIVSNEPVDGKPATQFKVVIGVDPEGPHAPHVGSASGDVIVSVAENPYGPQYGPRVGYSYRFQTSYDPDTRIYFAQSAGSIIVD